MTANHAPLLALDASNVVRPHAQTTSTAARVSFVSAQAFLVLLALLHVIKPELDPSWRFVSEYSIGRHGWVMLVAFLSLSLSCAAAVVGLRPNVTTRAGRVGLGLLVLVAVSLAVAGTFDMDPITASKDELTTHGSIHGFAAMLGIPAFPIAAMLISFGVTRQRSWASARRTILWSAHLTWISLILMFAVLGITLSQNNGTFGPDVVVGWPNRLVIIAYAAWLLVVARQAARSGSHQLPRA